MLDLGLARAGIAHLRERPAHHRPLVEYVRTLSPKLDRPEHLAPLCALFDRILAGEEVRALVSVPPQHGKTFTILSGMVQYLRAWPGRTSAYVSYSADYARSRSRMARDMAQRAGLSLRRDSAGVSLWETTNGSQFIATGAGGPLTGHPINGIGVIDDPYKNREEADSATIRSKVEDWYTSTFETRVHPGASVVICHTRWQVDDLIGLLKRFEGKAWENINLPAVSPETGLALWEERRPLWWLKEKRSRVGEYDWASMYQGEPRPRGAMVFQAATYATEMPAEYQVAIGVDFAYTAKKFADHSVAVVLARAWTGSCYVLDVVRRQVRAPDFAAELRRLQQQHPGAKCFAYGSGVESGVADLMRDTGVRIQFSTTHSDKFARAQPVAAAWNAGQILVPGGGGDGDAWVEPFVDEVTTFTGVGDRRDDQVDALAAAFDALSSTRGHVEEYAEESYSWGG